MTKAKKVVVTGTGAVASAVVRALVPAGYDVSTVGLGETGVKVFRELGSGLERNPETIEKVLKGDLRVDPFSDLGEFVSEVPHYQCDLSDKRKCSKKLFEKCHAVVMTAANPDSKQSIMSVTQNYRIDGNTIKSAVGAGVKNIIFTSSLWRTADLYRDSSIGVERFIRPEMESAPEDVPYAQAKKESVRFLRDTAADNKNRVFSYIDLGWHPRETQGFPISNLSPRMIQWWIAECEMQQHYLLMLNLDKIPFFAEKIANGENFFGFNGFSRNEPPAILNHPGFAYDLSNSARLGVKHEFNVYSVLEEKIGDWRRIPVPSD